MLKRSIMYVKKVGIRKYTKIAHTSDQVIAMQIYNPTLVRLRLLTKRHCTYVQELVTHFTQ